MIWYIQFSSAGQLRFETYKLQTRNIIIVWRVVSNYPHPELVVDAGVAEGLKSKAVTPFECHWCVKGTDRKYSSSIHRYFGRVYLVYNTWRVRRVRCVCQACFAPFVAFDPFISKEGWFCRLRVTAQRHFQDGCQDRWQDLLIEWLG